MEKYTIYCTQEQTLKAIELGAPIEGIFIPTAEQMIGWLEEQETIREIDVNLGVSDIWYYNIWDVNNYDIGGDNLSYSRKEATLSAIDDALEYLSNNK